MFQVGRETKPIIANTLKSSKPNRVREICNIALMVANGRKLRAMHVRVRAHRYHRTLCNTV